MSAATDEAEAILTEFDKLQERALVAFPVVSVALTAAIDTAKAIIADAAGSPDASQNAEAIDADARAELAAKFPK